MAFVQKEGDMTSTASEGGRVKISIHLRRYRRIAGKLVPPRRDGLILAGMNNGISRFGVMRIVMMHSCSVGRTTERDQNAKDKNGTHCICSVAPPHSYHVRTGGCGSKLWRLQARSNWRDYGTCPREPDRQGSEPVDGILVRLSSPQSG